MRVWHYRYWECLLAWLSKRWHHRLLGKWVARPHLISITPEELSITAQRWWGMVIVLRSRYRTAWSGEMIHGSIGPAVVFGQGLLSGELYSKMGLAVCVCLWVRKRRRPVCTKCVLLWQGISIFDDFAMHVVSSNTWLVNEAVCSHFGGLNPGYELGEMNRPLGIVRVESCLLSSCSLFLTKLDSIGHAMNFNEKHLLCSDWVSAIGHLFWLLDHCEYIISVYRTAVTLLVGLLNQALQFMFFLFLFFF